MFPGGLEPRRRRKSEIRNPNFEARIPKERRQAAVRPSAHFGLRHSGFLRISDFGFRILFLALAGGRTPEQLAPGRPGTGSDLPQTNSRKCRARKSPAVAIASQRRKPAPSLPPTHEEMRHICRSSRRESALSLAGR